MHDNEFNENPYIELALRYKEVERIKKETEALVFKYHDDFLKVFIADDSEFDALLNEAKLLKNKKAKQSQIDKVYYKMALIYKKWIPIEELLLVKNPLYKDLFKGLKMILEDCENRQQQEIDKKHQLDLNHLH